MRRQFLKGFTMLMLIVGLAFMSAVVSANGQTSIAVAAKVPFEFTVGDKVLPAGEYTVKSLKSSSDIMEIRTQGEAAMRLSTAIKTNKGLKSGKLVFHRYGQRYFLAEVWSGPEEAGRRLEKSRAQRSIESQLAAIPSKSDMAGSNYEVVEIVAMVR